MAVIYNEDGSLEIENDIDNSELLAQRADMETEEKFGALHGGANEKKLERDKKHEGWHEPTHKATDVKHICTVCGTRYWGRPNKHYCGTPCKEIAKKRRQRKRKRDIRDFKPTRGKAGEVYYKTGEDIITFVPAFHADTRARAKKYLEDTCEDTEQVNDYYDQVREVILK